MKLSRKTAWIRITRILSKKRAVSPVVATILIFGLILAGVVIGFVQVLPFIERAQTDAATSAITAGLLEVDKAIHELIGSGDIGSGTFSPVRSVTINKPRGILRADSSGLLFNIDVVTQDDSQLEPTGSAFGLGPVQPSIFLGRLQFEIQSPFDLLGGASRRYLNGPEPTTPRPQVLLMPQDEFGSEYLSLTNLTLTRGYGSYFNINLDYRVKLSIDIDPTTPALEVRLYIVRLGGTMPDVIGAYKTLKITANTNITSWEIPPDELDPNISYKLYFRNSESKAASNLIFDTEDYLPGTDLSDFTFKFNTIIYDVSFL